MVCLRRLTEYKCVHRKTPGLISIPCWPLVDDNAEPAMSSKHPFVLRWGIISTGSIASKFVSVRVREPA